MIRYATLAYGKDDAIYRQATLLVVSLLAHAPAPFEIVVVTNRPDRFAWFAGIVSVRVLPPGELEAWRGAAPFSMRQKLEAARAVTPAEGALVFLDADTVATTSLAPLAAALDEGTIFMHKQEFALGSSPRAGNRKLWAQLEGKTFGPWQFAATDAMWNSGVIALPTTERTRLDGALALYDTMAAAGIRHFATEQLVAGLVLARTGRLRPAERWFTHYWGNKRNFDEEIARRLEEWHRRKLTPRAAAETFRAHPIQLPAESRPGKIAKIRRWWRAR